MAWTYNWFQPSMGGELGAAHIGLSGGGRLGDIERRRAHGWGDATAMIVELGNMQIDH